METCDYILYQPDTWSYYGKHYGPEVVLYPDAANHPTLLSEHVGLSSCNTAFTFWLGADALYEVED